MRPDAIAPSIGFGAESVSTEISCFVPCSLLLTRPSAPLPTWQSTHSRLACGPSSNARASGVITWQLPQNWRDSIACRPCATICDAISRLNSDVTSRNTRKRRHTVRLSVIASPSRCRSRRRPRNSPSGVSARPSSRVPPTAVIARPTYGLSWPCFSDAGNRQAQAMIAVSTIPRPVIASQWLVNTTRTGRRGLGASVVMSAVAGGALGAVVGVVQRLAGAVAHAAVHRRIVRGRQRRRGRVARSAAVAREAVGGRHGQVARDAVVVARRAERADVRDRPRLPVARVARVGTVARRAVLAVHARHQAMATQPEVVVVVSGRHLAVALRAARLLVTQRAVVDRRRVVRAHDEAVRALPAELVARRPLVGAQMAVAGRQRVGLVLLLVTLHARVHAYQRVRGIGLDPLVAGCALGARRVLLVRAQDLARLIVARRAAQLAVVEQALSAPLPGLVGI